MHDRLHTINVIGVARVAYRFQLSDKNLFRKPSSIAAAARVFCVPVSLTCLIFVQLLPVLP
jgi:hypothetical protein